MTAPNSGQNPTQYLGVVATNPSNVVVAQRAPTTNDINYPIGTTWVYPTTPAVYMITRVVANSATWTQLG